MAARDCRDIATSYVSAPTPPTVSRIADADSAVAAASARAPAGDSEADACKSTADSRLATTDGENPHSADSINPPSIFADGDKSLLALASIDSDVTTDSIAELDCAEEAERPSNGVAVRLRASEIPLDPDSAIDSS
jgi:hypothetical protein